MKNNIYNKLLKVLSLIRHPQIKLTFLNKLGNRKKCNVCGNSFNTFIPYSYGKISYLLSNMKIIGSDADNFSCPICCAHDRTRHIFLYFSKLNLWNKFKHQSILHCSPEKHIYDKIKELKYEKYVIGDIDPDRYNFLKEIVKIDLTNIAFSNESFDIVIANHVLEHIPEYKIAIKEIYRVLKKDGFAILQTPYSNLLKKTFFDESINTNELRLNFYGEEDHYQIFGEDFFNVFSKIGFTIDRKFHANLISEKETYIHGVNPKEDLFLFGK